MRTRATTFTCDRCGKQKSYEHVPFGSKDGPDWGDKWVFYWPGQVGFLRSPAPDRPEPQTICMKCLTPDEREHVANRTRAAQQEDIPF